MLKLFVSFALLALIGFNYLIWYITVQIPHPTPVMYVINVVMGGISLVAFAFCFKNWKYL